MSRAVKLIGVVVVASLMTAAIVAAGTASHEPPKPIVTTVDRPGHAMRAATLDRCRVVTGQDPACEAAWDGERRRFFRTTGQ